MSLSTVIKSLYMSYAGGTLGTRVFRAVSLPTAAGAALPIFRVTNGNVLMTMLVGETIAPDTTGASNLSMQIDPVAAGAAVALCAATVINNDVAGTLYTFTGVVALMVTNDWILTPGVINILVANTNLTGAIDWYIEYRPLAPDAEITAL